MRSTHFYDTSILNVSIGGDKMTIINDVAYCRVSDALSIISGKWKATILLTLISKGPLRYGELKRLIGDITPKILAEQLKELEEEGLVLREEFASVPLKVIYSMTEYGMTIEPILTSLHSWGIKHQSIQIAKK